MENFWFWAVLVVGLIAGPILLMIAIGLFIPKEHVAERSAELVASPEELWAIVTDYESAPEWRRGLKSMEKLPDHNGQPAWKENSRTGSMPFFVETTEPPRKYVTTIIDKGMPFGGSWTQTIEPINGGRSRITVREDGVIYNPFFRFMARFFFGYHATMDGFLADMKKKVEGEVGA